MMRKRRSGDGKGTDILLDALVGLLYEGVIGNGINHGIEFVTGDEYL
jgi:hypothetical protein